MRLGATIANPGLVAEPRGFEEFPHAKAGVLLMRQIKKQRGGVELFTERFAAGGNGLYRVCKISTNPP